MIKTIDMRIPQLNASVICLPTPFLLALAAPRTETVRRPGCRAQRGTSIVKTFNRHGTTSYKCVGMMQNNNTWRDLACYIHVVEHADVNWPAGA